MEAKKMMVHLVLGTDAIVVQRPNQKIPQLPVDPNFEPKDLAPENIEYFFLKIQSIVEALDNVSSCAIEVSKSVIVIIVNNSQTKQQRIRKEQGEIY